MEKINLTPLQLAKKWHEAEYQCVRREDKTPRWWFGKWDELPAYSRERKVAIAKIFLDNEKKGKVK